MNDKHEYIKVAEELNEALKEHMADTVEQLERKIVERKIASKTVNWCNCCKENTITTIYDYYRCSRCWTFLGHDDCEPLEDDDNEA